jgi:hypothetical protein
MTSFLIEKKEKEKEKKEKERRRRRRMVDSLGEVG